MEQITQEEMIAGSQPTRGEKIMLTPVEEILEKETWDDIDVEVLVRNQHILDAETLEKLGITKPVPLAPEEVEAATAALGPVPEEGAEPVEAPVVETATEEGAEPANTEVAPEPTVGEVSTVTEGKDEDAE